MEGFTKSILTNANLDQTDRGTAPFALAMLKALELLPSPPPGTVWLDGASGGGCVFLTFIKEWDGKVKPEKAVAVDDEEYLVKLAKERVGAEKMKELNMEIKEIPTADLPEISGASDTHITCNFGVQMIVPPKDVLGLKELCRIIKPGGRFGFTAWIDTGVSTVFAKAGIPFTPLNQDWTDAGWLSSTLDSVGFASDSMKLKQVEIEQESKVEDFLDLMKHVAPKMWEGPAGAMLEQAAREMGEEEGAFKTKLSGVVVTISKSA